MKPDKRAIIFVDVGDSVAFKQAQIDLDHDGGEATANEIIEVKLTEIFELLLEADPDVTRETAEGDGFMAIGTRIPDLFKALFRYQNDWKGWQSGPVIRSTMGVRGAGGGVDDENRKDVEIDLTHRILKVTPLAGLVVTESAGVELKSCGYAKHLVMKTVELPGYTDLQSVYEANHYYAPPSDKLQPVGDRQSTTTVIERRRKGAAPAAVDTTSTAPADKFWKVFAVAAAVFVAVVVCIVLYRIV